MSRGSRSTDILENFNASDIFSNHFLEEEIANEEKLQKQFKTQGETAKSSSSTTVKQVKQKTRQISSSLANSTKDWRKKWVTMNKNRIESDNGESSPAPQQNGDLTTLKKQYGKVKEAVVDTSKAAMNKANQLVQ